MLRKIITLSIITAVVLIGVEKLIAQEATDKPQIEPGQRQVQEGRPRQRGRIDQPRRQQMDNETRAGRRAEAVRGRRQQEGTNKIEAMKKERQQEALQKNRRQKSDQKGAPRDRIRRWPQRTRPGQNLPMQQMLGRWNRGWQGRGMGRWSRGFQGRGMGGWGRGFQGRDTGGWGRGFQGRGTGGWGRGFQGRGMDGWGRGFQGRGINRPGSGWQPSDVRPFPPKPPEGEDVLVPAPPMQRRGMGRRGRALQEPNAPGPGPRRPGRRID